MLYRVSLTGKLEQFSVPQLGYLGYRFEAARQPRVRGEGVVGVQPYGSGLFASNYTPKTQANSLVFQALPGLVISGNWEVGSTRTSALKISH